MIIRLLDETEIEIIYNQYMVNDFGDNELKPLDRILIPIRNGQYRCLGLYENDVLLGYSFFVIDLKDYLLDYFAVVPEYRNRGIGSKFLSLLSSDFLENNQCVFIEVENPDMEQNEEERKIKINRKNFYLRNGYLDSGIKTTLFGVHYLILIPDHQVNTCVNELKSRYEKIYSDMLPVSLYKKHVNVYL